MDKTDFSAFAQYIPGFDFLQNLARQATGVTPGLQPQAGPMPSLGHWVAPTFSVEEIDKRIQDLRAVAFWLEQNGKALDATIQALEVQKMTLATLEKMNLNLKDVAESFKMTPEPQQPAKASEAAAQPDAEPQPAAPAVDPMQWWNSLTEQFTGIASNALQDMAGQAAKAAEQVAQTVQAGAEAAEKLVEQALEEVERKAAQAVEEAPAPARKSRAAAKSGATRPAAKKTGAAAKKAAPARSRSKPAAG
jgi:hypothetical protein